MNRLLNKKKSPLDETAPLSANNVPPANNSASAKRRWGRKKQAEQPVEEPVPLTLPTSENFRTSLIMPGLSTRFSMLREQDNPFSLIGKASDDSVVPPRFHKLQDIDEVSSIAQSFRPPFAESDRKGSDTSDGYGTDDDSSYTNPSGSIMSRARPGEGNNLFGGRQKIYKIPVGDSGSVNTLGGGESRGMRGRALYEDDVSMSAFQRYRMNKKHAESERRSEDDGDADDCKDALNSPASTFDEEKRHTTSSTNSGPSMLSASSTVATSITSLGLSTSNPTSQSSSPVPNASDRPRASQKKLYDSKLDQHQLESQSANLTRLNSIQRRTSNRQPNAKFLSNARSSPDLRGRPERSGSGSMPIIDLPSDEGLTTFESLRNLRNASPNASAPRLNAPTINENPDPLAEAISSADRGKATALGAFSRPKQQFDEQQYLQRQQSLLRQRSPSGSTRPSVDQNRPSLETRSGANTPSIHRPSADGQRPSIDSRFRPQFTRADRSFSSASSRHQQLSRPGSSGSGGPSNSSSPAKTGGEAAPVQVAPQPQGAYYQQQQEASEAWRTQKPSGDSSDDSQAQSRETKHQLAKLEQTPKQSPRISLERGSPDDVPQPLRRGPTPPSLLEHPALRSSHDGPTSLREKRSAWNPETKFAAFKMMGSDIDASDPSSQDSRRSSVSNPPEKHEQAHADGGLSLLRSHMRTVSDSSSIYPAPSDENTIEPVFRYDSAPGPAIHNKIDSRTSGWGMEGQARSGAEQRVRSFHQPIQDSPTIPAFKRSADLDDRERPDLAEWERELEHHHTRNDSGTTQAERDAFADELAQRQRAIRENLKIRVENSSRSSSPGASSKNGGVFESSKRPFGLLRNMSSRDSFRSDADKTRNVSSSAAAAAAAAAAAVDSSSSPAPMGRTLHSRMPAPRQSEESVRQPRQRSRPRQNSLATNGFPKESSLTLPTPPQPPPPPPPVAPRSVTEPDLTGSIRGRSVSGASAKSHSTRSRKVSEPQSPAGSASVHTQNETRFSGSRKASSSAASSRLDPPSFPTDSMPKQSLEILGLQGRPANPHYDPTAGRPSYDKPNIRVNTKPSSMRSANGSPITDVSGSGTPVSSLSARGEGVLGGSAHGKNALRNGPGASFTFPARNATQKPQKHPNQHARAVLKSEISEPTLMSSTSKVDTVELPPGASLSNGVGSDVDAVLAAQQAALLHGDGLVSTVPSTGTSFVGSPTSAALSASERNSSVTATTNSDTPSGRKSPPIGLISAEKGPLPPGLSSPTLPPPLPQGKKRGGFNNFFKRGKHGNGREDDDKENGEGDPFDDFVMRPAGGRLRIRKVSDETLGGKRRHQLVADTEMEGGMI